MVLLLSLQEKDIILDVLGRAGHPIINSLSLSLRTDDHPLPARDRRLNQIVI
jgi:hypothetical protein